MMTLFDSTPSFLIAFTNTLIHSLWIAAIIFLFVKGILLSVGDQKSGVRYWISSGGLILFVLSTVALLLYLYSPSSSGGSIVVDSDLRSLYLLTISADNASGELLTLNALYPILWKIYLLGLLVLSIRWILSALQIKTIIRRGLQPEESSMDLLQDLKRRLGIRKNIRLILSEKLKAPVLYGFFKPVIIVPTGMFFNLPHKQVESILIHELIHVKRLDFLVNLVQTILEVLFFFNPFIWLISRQIRNEREKYCDDYVIDSGSSPRDYAKALLNLSMLSSDSYDLVVSATGSNRHVLLKRIQRLLNIEMKTRNRQRAMLTYLVIVSFIVVIVSSGFSASLFSIEKNPKNETIVSRPEIVENTTESLEFVPDTIAGKAVEEMTEEEWQEYKEQMEFGIQEMKNIDWEEKQAEFEKQQQEMLTDMKIDQEQLEADLERARVDMKAIDKDKIKQEILEAQIHMDSIRANLDMEMIEEEIAMAREEIKLAIQEMEFNIQDTLIKAQEIEKVLQESLLTLADIKIDFDYDFDHDFDFDFDFDRDLNINIDSIMKQAQISIQEIDFEEIRLNIEEAMEKMEIEMQEMEERRAEAKRSSAEPKVKKEEK